MTILKLQNAGDSHTMTIKECEVVDGNYGEQVKFVGTDGNTLYLPKSSADNQLSREQVGLSYAECVGTTLTFSRDPNKKPGAKPYWGINIASPAMAQATQSRRIPPPTEHVGNRPPVHIPEIDGPLDDDTPYADEDDGGIIGAEPPMTAREVNAKIAAVSKRGGALAFYVGLYGQMLQGMSDLHTKTNVPLTADAVQAATATVYIRMGNAGLLP